MCVDGCKTPGLPSSIDLHHGLLGKYFPADLALKTDSTFSCPNPKNGIPGFVPLARHSGWFLLDFQRLREAMIQERVSFFGVEKNHYL